MGEKMNSIIDIMRQLIQQQEQIIKLIGDVASEKKETATSDGASASADKKLPEDVRIRRFKLHRAALNGDWELAKGIYDVSNNEIGVRISKRGETALHIAAAAERIDFVKELVKKMTKEEVAEQDELERTALFFAATSGKVELAKEMMKKNKNIATTADKFGTLPICMAASLGHKQMVEYLYQETGHSYPKEKLLVTSIETDLYDFALRLLTDDPDLATAGLQGEQGITALRVLARKNLTFSNLANQNRRGIFKRCFDLGAKFVESKKLMQAHQLVERIWKRIILLSDEKIAKLISEPKNLVVDAAERGNVEFLSILIREYPDLIWKIDTKENYYSIFHTAVKHRQEDVFNLIYEIGSSREIIFDFDDKEKNNILHLAGMLAPLDRLNIVSGAAFQMQRELLWFKQVESFRPKLAEVINDKGFTPRALFTEEHKNLKDMGEKWMKDTAGSCMVVAALIATVAFAAAFTVPGGNNGDTGFPLFLEKVSFKIFAIFDVISLVSSSASIMNFLSILTSRYAEDDFLRLLPRKLRFGLLTLFMSMAAMMVVFSTTYFIIFNGRGLWLAILVAVIASTPVIMFFWQHFQLFYDVVRSTHDSDSLFQKGKNTVFRKEGEANDQNRKSKILNANLKFQCTCSTGV